MRASAAYYRQLNEAAARSRAKAAAMPPPVPVAPRSERPRPTPQQMPPVEMTPRAAAAGIFNHLLGNGETVAANTIKRLALEAGIAKQTLRRAMEDLGVKSFKKKNGWFWRM